MWIFMLILFLKWWCIVVCIFIVMFFGINIGEGDSDVDVNVIYGWVVVDVW